MFGLFNKKRIYLDHAGATPVRPEAAEAMLSALSYRGNPGAIHTEGVAAKGALDRARSTIADELGCKAREVLFTSGGTEANNLAILGFFKKVVLSGVKPKESHWVVSAIEHPSVLACFDHIEEMGGRVTRVAPDQNGVISVAKVVAALTQETVLVSVGWANGEIGTVQPIHAISQALREHERSVGRNVLLHTDAGQAPLYVPAQVHGLGVDMMSLDSGKLYGPRGIGALYLSNRVLLAPMILGGGQERGLRAGTENVALAAGFAEALLCAGRERKSEGLRLRAMRDELARELEADIPGLVVNGSPKHSLPHILNVSIPGELSSEYIVLALDHAGIAAATKSACQEGEGIRSAVVAALPSGGQGTDQRALNTLRLSLGRGTRAADLRRFVRELKKILKI